VALRVATDESAASARVVETCSTNGQKSVAAAGGGCDHPPVVTETSLAVFVLAAFAIPMPILSWLDRKPRAGAE